MVPLTGEARGRAMSRKKRAEKTVGRGGRGRLVEEGRLAGWGAANRVRREEAGGKTINTTDGLMATLTIVQHSPVRCTTTGQEKTSSRQTINTRYRGSLTRHHTPINSTQKSWARTPHAQPHAGRPVGRAWHAAEVREGVQKHAARSANRTRYTTRTRRALNGPRTTHCPA